MSAPFGQHTVDPARKKDRKIGPSSRFTILVLLFQRRTDDHVAVEVKLPL